MTNVVILYAHLQELFATVDVNFRVLFRYSYTDCSRFFRSLIHNRKFSGLRSEPIGRAAIVDLGNLRTLIITRARERPAASVSTPPRIRMPQADRPLSPHLQIYKPQLTSVLSISHRATGIALSVGTLLLVWWLLAGAIGAGAYGQAQAFLGSWIG